MIQLNREVIFQNFNCFSHVICTTNLHVPKYSPSNGTCQNLSPIRLLVYKLQLFKWSYCCKFSKQWKTEFHVLLYFDLWPSQKCHSKVMHRKEVTHSNGSYERKSRGNWLTKWDKLKFPWYTHRLMHRKRVTCELHDSYFRLMTIKHAIPKIEWALNYYITQSRQKSDS